MYEDFFKLRGRPFLPTPRVDRYFPTPTIEDARLTLARCIERGEGAGLLVGPAGTGKTLLCHLLARQFDDAFGVAQLTGGRLATRSALFQAILYELGRPYRGLDEGELRLALFDVLEPGDEGNAGLLLLVDEAHTLPLKLLEEIRMMTNLVRDGQPRVRVVLAGGPLLEERFASPKLSSFAQRLAARCYLEPLDAKQTAAYVQAQIAAVGGDASHLIDPDALRSIFRATDGIPRLVNQVCDHALLLASLGGLSRLSTEAIEEAWADLQQLPVPWNDAPRDASPGDIVEFGQLPDAGGDLPQAIPFRKSQTQPLHVAQTDDSSGASTESALGDDQRHGHVGFGGTEVDLDFPEFGDPSSEEFQEEEVVLDRYASEVEMFANVPRVTSWEGRQLASMLWPVDPPSAAALPESPAPKSGTVSTADAPAASAPTGVGPIVEFAGTGVSRSDAIRRDRPAASECSETSEFSQTAFWAGARAGGDDRNLIIVEDDAAPAVPLQPRKRAYRQLFSKLRRG